MDGRIGTDFDLERGASWGVFVSSIPFLLYSLAVVLSFLLCLLAYLLRSFLFWRLQ
jgi:hypothetical protein